MKKLFFLIAFSLSLNITYLTAQETHVDAPSKATPEVLSWDKTVHEFGKIPQGIPVEAKFTLTNNSKEVLHINDIKTTCGCTVADYSRNPIKSGESTTITTTYNAKKEGSFNKSVKVYTNLNTNAITLRLKGEVVSGKN